MTAREMQTAGFATETCLVRLRRGGVQHDEQHAVYYIPKVREQLVAHVSALQRAAQERVVAATAE